MPSSVIGTVAKASLCFLDRFRSNFLFRQSTTIHQQRQYLQTSLWKGFRVAPVSLSPSVVDNIHTAASMLYHQHHPCVSRLTYDFVNANWIFLSCLQVLIRLLLLSKMQGARSQFWARWWDEQAKSRRPANKVTGASKREREGEKTRIFFCMCLFSC